MLKPIAFWEEDETWVFKIFFVKGEHFWWPRFWFCL